MTSGHRQHRGQPLEAHRRMHSSEQRGFGHHQLVRDDPAGLVAQLGKRLHCEKNEPDARAYRLDRMQPERERIRDRDRLDYRHRIGQTVKACCYAHFPTPFGLPAQAAGSRYGSVGYATWFLHNESLGAPARIAGISQRENINAPYSGNRFHSARVPA
jgi:hypothetical protein